MSVDKYFECMCHAMFLSDWGKQRILKGVSSDVYVERLSQTGDISATFT